MADAHASVVDLSRLNREALEALVVAQQEKLLSRNSEIEHLKLIIAKLRRMMFGTKSEKIARQVEQLELKLEELETGEAARPPAAAPASNTPRRKRRNPGQTKMTLTQYGYHDRGPCVHKGHLRLSYISRLQAA
jgi:hypothetical protein